ncbi:MAG: hypothetical protein HFACDABA_01236 [Anaerolineales bacterium]|nr:hypothetical protein [Anaerolineales bacterium]
MTQFHLTLELRCNAYYNFNQRFLMPDTKPPNASMDSPYRLRNYFLSTPEIALFRQLQRMIGDRYIICPKVALTDIFTIVRPNENVHFYNKIFRKHVDFLLCDPQTFKPAIAVEVVKSIAKNETRASDQFMEELFLQEGIPLAHVPLGERYEASDLVHLFQLAVTKAKEIPRLPRQDSAPMCPVCGKMMVLRIQRDGDRGGKKYYGCMDNPRCPGAVALD